MPFSPSGSPRYPPLAELPESSSIEIELTVLTRKRFGGARPLLT